MNWIWQFPREPTAVYMAPSHELAIKHVDKYGSNSKRPLPRDSDRGTNVTFTEDGVKLRSAQQLHRSLNPRLAL